MKHAGHAGKEIARNEQLARRLGEIATQLEKGCLVINGARVVLPEQATLKLAAGPFTGDALRVKPSIKWKE